MKKILLLSILAISMTSRSVAMTEQMAAEKAQESLAKNDALPHFGELPTQAKFEILETAVAGVKPTF